MNRAPRRNEAVDDLMARRLRKAWNVEFIGVSILSRRASAAGGGVGVAG
jgi:hypothetical protein